jgi:glycosyltransferase involved in cell wall biosynthesis
MKKVGVFVGENGNWSFFKEIFNEIDSRHKVNLFKERTYTTPILSGRLNMWAHQNGIRAILRRSDVCFFEWASELLVSASYMPKYCPIVTRLHSFEIFAWAPKVNWDHVDRVIFVSEEMRRKFNIIYPNHAQKTTVIHSACLTNKFIPVNRTFGLNLGMLCSIHPRKRIYEIIMMLNELIRQGYKAHLHIAGERIHGPDLDEYYVATQNLVHKLDLAHDVTFYGKVEDTAKWLQKIDIFITNSYWEGLPASLCEAMASGCYCLSHFWDGAEEALPRENLYSTENELQQKIIEYYNFTTEERKSHQEQMRRIACEKFDLDKNKMRICEIIEEAALLKPQ